MSKKAPQIVGFGEAHAQQGQSSLSTAKRFGQDLLPELAPNAHFLLVELIQPPTGCQEAKKQVQKESDTITEGQAEGNQNDYIALGQKARSLHLPVDILRPDCAEFEAIARAPEPTIRMMTSIAELSAKRLISEAKNTTAERPLVITYGGALHNDAEPRAGFEDMTFGPALLSATNGRYLEIDLILSEGLETSPWSRLNWFAAVLEAAQSRGPGEAVLIERGPSSYALLLEETEPISRNLKEAPNHLEQKERDHR